MASRDNMTCSLNNSYLMSDLCLHNYSSHADECFPNEIRHWSPYAGIWCIFNSFAGFTGNLLTILAIPYAAKQKKYVKKIKGIHHNKWLHGFVNFAKIHENALSKMKYVMKSEKFVDFGKNKALGSFLYFL